MRLNHFSNFLMVVFVEVSVFLDSILYFLSPVCIPICIQDRTQYLISRMIFPMISVFPSMIVLPKCSISRRNILESSPQLIYFLGYAFLFCLIGETFGISPSTCITFYIQGITLYIVSIFSPLTLILYFRKHLPIEQHLIVVQYISLNSELSLLPARERRADVSNIYLIALNSGATYIT